MTHIVEEVRELLASRVDTPEKLAIVIALHETPSSTTIADLARRLDMAHEVAHATLCELQRSLLVDVHTAAVRLLPPTERDRVALRLLVELAREDPATIQRVLDEVALERIRKMAAGMLAIGKRSG